MNETSTLAKVLTWLIIGTVVIVALKIAVPVVATLLSLTVAAVLLIAPVVLLGAVCWFVYRLLRRRNAY